MPDILTMLWEWRRHCGREEGNELFLTDFLPLYDFARHNYRSREVSFFKEFCKQILWNIEGYHYDPRLNGENLLIQRIGLLRPAVVFDVGANVGEWTLMALQVFEEARIHAFEIVPDTFATLAARTAEFDQVALNDCGLFDRDGDLGIYVNDAFSQVSSFLDRTPGARKVDCRIMRGDDYLSSRGIGHVDFLKIDAEGADHHVLAGFSRALADRRISLIQFEYGRAAIDTKFLLKDYYRVLQGHDFIIGKLRHDGVDFKEYSELDENFLGPNYVACLRTRPDVIGHIRAPVS